MHNSVGTIFEVAAKWHSIRRQSEHRSVDDDVRQLIRYAVRFRVCILEIVSDKDIFDSIRAGRISHGRRLIAKARQCLGKQKVWKFVLRARSKTSVYYKVALSDLGVKREELEIFRKNDQSFGLSKRQQKKRRLATHAKKRAQRIRKCAAKTAANNRQKEREAWANSGLTRSQIRQEKKRKRATFLRKKAQERLKEEKTSQAA